MSAMMNRKDFFNKIINLPHKDKFHHLTIRNEIVKDIMSRYNLSNFYEVPQIEKIIISCGPSKDVKIESVFEYIKLIAGQSPVFTIARKSSALYKIRAGMNIGVKVSLTGANMYNFLYKFPFVLLNNRDFEALSIKAINQTKNSCQLNIGFEHIGFFPEMPYLGSSVKIGCTITIVSKCGTKTTLDKELLSNVLYYHGIPMKEIIEGGK